MHRSAHGDDRFGAGVGYRQLAEEDISLVAGVRLARGVGPDRFAGVVALATQIEAGRIGHIRQLRAGRSVFDLLVAKLVVAAVLRLGRVAGPGMRIVANRARDSVHLLSRLAFQKIRRDSLTLDRAPVESVT